MVLKTVIFVCFPDFHPPRGRRTRLLDISPPPPKLFDVALGGFSGDAQVLSTAFLAFWAARVISGPFHHISCFSHAKRTHAFFIFGDFETTGQVIFRQFSVHFLAPGSNRGVFPGRRASARVS